MQPQGSSQPLYRFLLGRQPTPFRPSPTILGANDVYDCVINMLHRLVDKVIDRGLASSRLLLIPELPYFYENW